MFINHWLIEKLKEKNVSQENIVYYKTIRFFKTTCSMYFR